MKRFVHIVLNLALCIGPAMFFGRLIPLKPFWLTVVLFEIALGILFARNAITGK